MLPALRACSGDKLCVLTCVLVFSAGGGDTAHSNWHGHHHHGQLHYGHQQPTAGQRVTSLMQHGNITCLCTSHEQQLAMALL
jgi:hypothetical protein